MKKTLFMKYTTHKIKTSLMLFKIIFSHVAVCCHYCFKQNSLHQIFPFVILSPKRKPSRKTIARHSCFEKKFFFKSVSDNAERWFNMDNGESPLLNCCVIQREESMKFCIHAFSFLLKHHELQPSHAKITYHLPLCLSA